METSHGRSHLKNVKKEKGNTLIFNDSANALYTQQGRNSLYKMKFREGKNSIKD
jgi:hypothetical protein